MLSTLIAPVPAMFCSNWLDLDQSVATPAQNSYAIKIQPKGTKSPRLGHFLFFAGLGPKRKFIFMVYLWFFMACNEDGVEETEM